MRPVVIITGASSGLGSAIAETFAHSGYDLLVIGRDETRLNEFVMKLSSKSPDATIRPFAGDVTVMATARQLIQACEDHFHRLDVLVNCVGASDRGRIEDVTDEQLDAMLRVNLYSTLYCSRAALPMLRQSRGVIVNIGSLASKVGARYLGAYAIAKHALAGLTQQLRLELRNDGVHVAIVCPGPISREISDGHYQVRNIDHLPSSAAKPAAGAQLKCLDPNHVAGVILKCVRHRTPEVILPSHVRFLLIITAMFPRLGDWLTVKFTSSGSD